MLDRQGSLEEVKRLLDSPDVWEDCPGSPPMLAPLRMQLQWQLRPSKSPEWGLW